MTFFGPSMTEKTVVEARSRKISGSSRLQWEVGGRAMRVSLVRTRVCEALRSDRTRAIALQALTKPDRLHCRLRVTEPERSIDGC